MKITKRGTRSGGNLRLQYAITDSGVGRSRPAITNAIGCPATATTATSLT